MLQKVDNIKGMVSIFREQSAICMPYKYCMKSVLATFRISETFPCLRKKMTYKKKFLAPFDISRKLLLWLLFKKTHICAGINQYFSRVVWYSHGLEQKIHGSLIVH